MPKDAEFEEKEYETPLYVELANGSQYVWSPGQVLEKSLGFDGTQFTENLTFWKMIGRTHAITPGIDLNSIRKRLSISRLLPTFRCNVLLQVKRPQYMLRRTKGYYLYSPYFRFEIEDEQQKILEKLATRVRDRAFIGYASAAFHKLTDLYLYTIKSQLVSQSNFIKVSRLKEHSHWAYSRPGADGQALSEPEFLQQESFYNELRQLAIHDNEWKSQNDKMEHSELVTRNLEQLSKNIRVVCLEISDNYYSEEVLKWIDIMDTSWGKGAPEAIRFFSNIQLFCSVLGVSWFVVGWMRLLSQFASEVIDISTLKTKQVTKRRRTRKDIKFLSGRSRKLDREEL